MGGGDLQDIHYGARYASKVLELSGKPAITGGSYGGYLVLQALTTQPDEWAGGVALAPTTDFTDSYKLADAHYRAWNIHFLGGTPEEKPDLYKERSPITHLSQLKRPVLMLCGENDPVCPLQPVQRFFEEAKKRGLPVELAVTRDEGHGALVNVNAIRDTVLGLEHLKNLFQPHVASTIIEA